MGVGYLSLIQLQAEILIYFIWNNWICHQIDFHRITKDLKFRFCANFNIYIHWNWHSRHLYTLYTLSYKFTPLGFLTYWKVSKVGGVWPVRKIPEMTWSAFAYSLRVGRSWGELGAVRGSRGFGGQVTVRCRAEDIVSWESININQGRPALPKRMNFRKNSKRPLTPPPSFSENYIALFATKVRMFIMVGLL